MGPWLLAIENLTFALLCVALVFSLIARSPARWQRNLLRLIPVGLLLFYVALAGVDVFVQFRSSFSLGLRQHLLIAFLLIGYLLGMLILWRRARRERFSEAMLEMGTAARCWSPGKLALTASVTLFLFGITWWQLDTAAQQQLKTLRVEAGVKALGTAPGKPLDEENAALVYEQAFALLANDEDWKEQRKKWDLALSREPPALQLPDPELEAYFEEQAPAIALFRQAAELPACQFEHNYAVPSIAEPMDEIYHLRTAARLFMLRAHAEGAKGDLKSAIRDVQWIRQMSAQLRSDPMLVSLLVALAYDGIAHATLQELLSGREPTIEELRPLKFDDLYSRTRFLTRAFRMEEAFGLSAFAQYSLSGAENEAFLGEINGLEPVSPVVLSCYRVFLLEEDVAASRSLISRYIHIAGLPFSEADEQTAALQKSMEKNRSGCMTQLLIPALAATINVSARAAAEHYTAQTAVAVHRFRADEGKLPPTLQDLVPKYLSAAPLDPFDDQPLRWKIKGDEWVVYSIGENLKDNGGIPRDHSTYPPEGDICFFSRVPTEEPANEGQP